MKPYKKKNYNKSSAPNKRVEKIDIHGNIVQIYESVAQAKEMDKISRWKFEKCANNKYINGFLYKTFGKKKTSQYNGVSLNHGLWVAKYSNVHIGSYDTETAAAIAYNGHVFKLKGHEHKKYNTIKELYFV